MPSDEDFYIPVFIFGGANLGIVFITTKFIRNFNTLCVVSSLYLITLFFRFDSLVLSSLKKIIFLCRKEEMFYALI